MGIEDGRPVELLAASPIPGNRKLSDNGDCPDGLCFGSCRKMPNLS